MKTTLPIICVAIIIFSACGQRIMVFPSLSMVVVFTEGAYNQPTSSDAMISGYILPAVQE